MNWERSELRAQVRRKEVARYSPVGSLNGNAGHGEAEPVDFLVLKNCYVDERVGAVMVRGGDALEDVGSSVGPVLGCGEHVRASSGFIGQSRAMLVNFAGSVFKYNNGGTPWTSVTLASECAFDTSLQCQMAQLGKNIFIAGGFVGKWGGPGTTITKAGIKPPSLAPTVTATPGNVTWVEGTRYMYTFVNSTTGAESDWSPLSADLGARTDSATTLTMETTAETGVDKKRIYRYLDGGATMYFVNEVPLSDATYTDNLSDALTGALAAEVGENQPAPVSRIVCAFNQRLWYVNAQNPYQIHFTKPYVGQDVDLEYVPDQNLVVCNKPVTGLIVVNNKMLVFHPRDISFISGTSEDDFTLNPFRPGIGTSFANSIATNGNQVICLAEQGWVDVTQEQPHLSREIDHVLQPILATQYNHRFYASAVWNPAIRQFVVLVTGRAFPDAHWEEVGVGTVDEEWEDSVSSADAEWFDEHLDDLDDTASSYIWGWSPEQSGNGRNRWMYYTCTGAAGDQSGVQLAAYATVLFHPQPSTEQGSPQQDRTYVGGCTGLVAATRGGYLLSIFRKDLTTSSGGDSVAFELVTGPIAPGAKSGGYKRFESIFFADDNINPFEKGFSISYYIDVADVHLVTSFGLGDSSTFAAETNASARRFPLGNARFINLRIRSQTGYTGRLILSEFYIHFRERLRRIGQ